MLFSSLRDIRHGTMGEEWLFWGGIKQKLEMSRGVGGGDECRNLPPDDPCCHGNEIWDKKLQLGLYKSYLLSCLRLTWNKIFAPRHLREIGCLHCRNIGENSARGVTKLVTI